MPNGFEQIKFSISRLVISLSFDKLANLKRSKVQIVNEANILKLAGRIGIVIFAIGGALLLDSLAFLMHDAITKDVAINWLSEGMFTGFIALLLIGVGLYYILESANQH